MLERVSQETASIESVMRRYQTYSEVVAAVGRLHSTLGMGILKAGVHSNGLKDLTRYVGAALEVRMSGASTKAELDLFKTKTMSAKTKIIDIKKRNVVFIKKKQENIVNGDLFMYPDLSNILGGVDVPKIKTVTGSIENYQTPFILGGLAASLGVISNTILSGLDGASKGIVPVLDKFSDEVGKQLKNPGETSP
jgi:hypothetical protein